MKREPALRGRKKREPALRGRKKRGCGGCVLLALLGALAVAVYLVVARSEVSSLRWRLALLGQGEALNRPAGADDTPVRVLLRPGQSAASLAAALAAADLIHSERLFLAHLRAEGLDRRLVAGEYYLDSTRSIVAVAAALGALGSSPFPYPALVAQDAGLRVRFTVAAGETVAGIGQHLLAAGVIDDAAFFERYVARNRLAAEIQPAIYFFSPAQHIGEIAQRLTDAAASVIPLQIVPGMRLEEIARALDESAHPFAFRGADFLYLVGQGAVVAPEFRALTQLPTGASLEGFFLPQFHRLSPDISAQELRDLLLEAFPQALAETSLPEEAAAQGWTIYEAVTLAAIVEREALFFRGIHGHRGGVSQSIGEPLAAGGGPDGAICFAGHARALVAANLARRLQQCRLALQHLPAGGFTAGSDRQPESGSHRSGPAARAIGLFLFPRALRRERHPCLRGYLRGAPGEWLLRRDSDERRPAACGISGVVAALLPGAGVLAGAAAAVTASGAALGLFLMGLPAPPITLPRDDGGADLPVFTLSLALQR